MAVTATVFSVAGFKAAAVHFIQTKLIGMIIRHVVTSFVMKALSPKPKFGNAAATGAASTGEASNRGYTVTASGSALDHQIIYGKMRVGGARLFDHTTGGDNKYLHRVLGFAGHEIEEFETIYISDEAATIDGSGNVTSPSRYNGVINIQTHLGAADQSADAGLVSAVTDWTADHRLRGIAYLYCKFTYDADKFPNGLPQITAVIKGKKVYDPRSSATAWSDNPALCVRDYILSSGYGLGEAAANIDDTSVTTAANICDQTNTTLGTTRYTANGAFTTAIQPGEFLENILSSMFGTLWYAQGKWRIKAGAFTASVLSLDENDLRSGITVSTRHSRRDNFNEIKGTFKGDESNYQVTDFPPVTNSAFVTADNGQVTVADVELPFTDNSIEARRIARIMLESNRQQLTVKASFGMRALALQVGDTVTITNERFGWSSKLFQVAEWTFGLGDQLGFEVDMTLKETAASIYDEVDDGLVYERDNTTLLSPFEVPSVGISLSSELRTVRGKVMSVLLADITASSDLIDSVEAQFKKTSDTNFSPLSVSSGYTGTLRAESFGIVDGYYDVRARAINALGVRGDFNTVSSFYVDALGAIPADVTNFSGNVVSSTLHLNWTPVSDLDLAYYNIRYSNQTSGATYSSSEDLAQVVSSTSSISVPAVSGTYFIKAVDASTSGSNVSANPTSFIVTNVDINDLNVVATLTENPSFSGSKTNTVKDAEDNLVLTQSGGSFAAEGIYYFANSIDLGQKYTSRISSNVSMLRFDQTSTFDSASGFFDNRAGLFDGDPDAFDDVSFQMQERHTDDNPSGSPTYTAWSPFTISDIAARAFQFRIKLQSTNTQASPLISTLSATVDMPDHTASESDITFTGSKAVTFAKAFKAAPSIGLSLANLADGDRYTITSKSRTGFTINIFTGSSASTNAITMDYVAKGFGKEIT